MLMKGKNKNTNPLDSISGEEGFKVPEGYFESFEDRLRKKIEVKEENSIAKSRLGIFRSPLLLAASILGFALISYVFIGGLLREKDQTIYAETIDIGLYDYDIDLLEETYSKVSSEEESNTENLPDEDEIIDFLIDQNIEIELIAEYL
jgi:hypothetical protein